MAQALTLEELNGWALRIDAALDWGDEDALRAEWGPLRATIADVEPPFQEAALLYNQANILAMLCKLRAQREERSHWGWNSAELMAEVRCLRSTATLIHQVPIEQGGSDLRLRIWTNLGCQQHP